METETCKRFVTVSIVTIETVTKRDVSGILGFPSIVFESYKSLFGLSFQIYQKMVL